MSLIQRPLYTSHSRALCGNHRARDLHYQKRVRLRVQARPRTPLARIQRRVLLQPHVRLPLPLPLPRAACSSAPQQKHRLLCPRCCASGYLPL
jgi:hypothetical protein